MKRKLKAPPKLLVETWLNALSQNEYPEFREVAKERIEAVFGNVVIAEYYLFSIGDKQDVA